MEKPKLFSILKHRKTELTKEQLLKDIISGIIVAIIALPLSVALGISSGVTPEKGLITAIIAGFFVSALGGSRVQIGGPTGAFVVIIYGIIEKYGIEGLVIATFMAGIILIIFGLLKFGNLIKFIPYPITIGFTAGIAVTLFSTQVKDFLGLQIEKVPSEFISKWGVYLSNLNTINVWTLILGIVSLVLIITWPKINKTVPGSLIALIVVTVITYIFKIPVATIGSQFGELSSSFPKPAIPSINLATIKSLIVPAFTIAVLGGLESLLSAVVSDGMIGKKHESNMELIAQGVSNIASALFGGIPATGAIARTAANVKNGGRTPIAGIVHAITLLLIMKIFMPLAKFIPLTTLAAILIVVSYNMSGWRTFKDMLKAPKGDVLILVTTFFLTVVFDLVIAIGVGMVMTMFLFMKKMSTCTKITEINKNSIDGTKEATSIDTKHVGKNILIYDMKGPMFFGVTDELKDKLLKGNNAKVIILKMKHISMIDITAYDVLQKLQGYCKENNKKLIISEMDNNIKKVIDGIDGSEGLEFHEKLTSAIKRANEFLLA